MDTNALKRLIAAKGPDNVYVCARCGSTDIQYQAWVDANYHVYDGGDLEGNDEEAQWCGQCSDHVRFCSVADFEKKMDSDVLALTPETAEKLKTGLGKLIAGEQKDWPHRSYLLKRRFWLDIFGDVKSSRTEHLSPIERIRRKAAADIGTILQRYGLDEIEVADIDESNLPIVKEGKRSDDTYTLDRIALTDSGLEMDASNCFDSITLQGGDIPTDALFNTLYHLKEYEYIIRDLAVRKTCMGRDMISETTQEQ